MATTFKARTREAELLLLPLALLLKTSLTATACNMLFVQKLAVGFISSSPPPSIAHCVYVCVYDRKFIMWCFWTQNLTRLIMIIAFFQQDTVHDDAMRFKPTPFPTTTATATAVATNNNKATWFNVINKSHTNKNQLPASQDTIPP